MDEQDGRVPEDAADAGAAGGAGDHDEWSPEKGRRLRAWMTWAEFASSRQLGQAIGCHFNTINHWLAGTRNGPTGSSLTKLLRVLDITPQQLLHEDPPPRPAPASVAGAAAEPDVTRGGAGGSASAWAPGSTAIGGHGGPGGALLYGTRFVIVGASPEGAERIGLELARWLGGSGGSDASTDPSGEEPRDGR